MLHQLTFKGLRRRRRLVFSSTIPINRDLISKRFLIPLWIRGITFITRYSTLGYITDLNASRERSLAFALQSTALPSFATEQRWWWWRTSSRGAIVLLICWIASTSSHHTTIVLAVVVVVVMISSLNQAPNGSFNFQISKINNKQLAQ